MTRVLGLIVISAVLGGPPKLKPHSLLLRGTPTGHGTLENQINANFFLTKHTSIRRVHVTIAGHRASVKYVGAKSNFVVARLKSSIKLRYSRRYAVKIRACNRSGCSSTTRHALLPKPSL
jgi:hypothetical protein